MLIATADDHLYDIIKEAGIMTETVEPQKRLFLPTKTVKEDEPPSPCNHTFRPWKASPPTPWMTASS